MEAVTADFTSGEVYEAATAYYSQNPTPNNFIVLGVFGTNTPATLTGSAPATLAAMKAITAGGFDITINGTITHVSAINLSGVTDYASIATIINNKLGICLYIREIVVLVPSKLTVNARPAIDAQGYSSS